MPDIWASKSHWSLLGDLTCTMPVRNLDGQGGEGREADLPGQGDLPARLRDGGGGEPRHPLSLASQAQPDTRRFWRRCSQVPLFYTFSIKGVHQH